MRLVFFSHSAETGVFRVGSHHLVRELGRAGHQVAHVSTPLTLGHAARLRDPDVRARLRLTGRPREREGVRHVVACAPLPLRFAGLNHRLCAASVRQTLGDDWLRAVDVVFVDQALFGPMIPDLVPGARIVYRPTDTHDPATPIGRAELALAEVVDGFVATSQPVLESLGPRIGEVPSMVLENGVELEPFARAAARALPRTGDVVYVGALDHRFDWSAVAQIATELPERSIDLIGPVPAEPPAGLPSNVRLLGPLPYASLPGALARYRVGLLPLNSSPVNAGRSPMKYFEYLASGLHIVARSTPALERLAAPGAATYCEPADAAALVAAALEAGPNDAGAEAAAAFDWSERARRLAVFAAEVAAA